MHFSIELVRKDEAPVQLGTARDIDTLLQWFEGAYKHGLLPDPPAYTDEIQVWECSPNQVCAAWDPPRVLKFVWRVSWMQFEAKPRIEIVQ